MNIKIDYLKNSINYQKSHIMKIKSLLNKMTCAILMLISTASFVDAQNTAVDIKAEMILTQLASNPKGNVAFQ